MSAVPEFTLNIQKYLENIKKIKIDEIKKYITFTQDVNTYGLSRIFTIDVKIDPGLDKLEFAI